MAIVASGTWWRVEDDGTLYVYCTGDMPSSEWDNYTSSITAVDIASGVTSIANFAFVDCSAILTVTIPGSVTSIGRYAFDGCRNLSSVTIPSGVTSIGIEAFSACHSLTSVTIPSGVTSIQDGTFDNCDALTSVAIPDSVTNIKADAFRFCDNLADVYYGGTQAQWNAITIDRNNDALEEATIHYSGSANTPSVVTIPAIPVAGLGNPLAAIVQTLNLVIQNVNALLASNSNTANQEGGAT